MDGKLVLNWGAKYFMDTVQIVDVSGQPASYEWYPTTSDGAQIVMDRNSLRIQDTDVTIAGNSAFVP
jgi:hypothetical protein